MNKPKIYIDGQEGTTGLQIYERLGGRDDLELLLIDEDKRKDTEERRKFLNAADLVFLCLPDAAAVEAVSLIENGNTKVIDASTAHRTAPGWAYGFAELSKLHRAQICESMRVSNPGCHATGFISIVYPLVGMGILPADTPLSCFSLTGYSGGGQKLVRVAPEGADGKLYGAGKAGDDDLTLTVAGNDGQLTVTALFDNLGKGASGAAVQNMNLMLGFEETEGLSLS